MTKRQLFITTAILCLVSSSAMAATIVVPPIEVQTLTHDFLTGPGFPFPIPITIARDSFEIGSGYTGGDAFSIPSISNGDMATIRIQAPAGKKFVVHDANAQLGLDFYWQAGGDVSSLSGGTATFENLTGSAPLESYSFLAVGNSGNVIKAELQFQSLGLFEFTAIDITIPVQSSPAAGARNFGSVQSNSSPAFYALVLGTEDHTILSIESVPEPGSITLLLAGSVALCRRRMRS
jgi:hypothetical protein